MNGDLYSYDDSSQRFTFQMRVDIAILKGSEYNYALQLEQDDEVVLKQDINNEMHMRFNKEEQSAIWLTTTDEELYIWSLKFSSPKLEKEFKEQICKCLYERNAQFPFSKVSQADVDWMVAGFDQSFDEKDDDAMDVVVDVEGDSVTTPDPRAKNNALSVGLYNEANSFVARGSTIGVFRDDGDSFRLATTVSSTKKDGKFVSPKEMMLHEQDTSLLFLDPQQGKNTIFRMDLNRGEIVDEWKIGAGFRADKIFPETKLAQMEPTKTLMGMHSQGVYRLDPRKPGEKQVDNKSFTYKAPTYLSCGATTGMGQLALGSEKGVIRLYSMGTLDKMKLDDPETNVKAKTQFPGYGDPILGIDVTDDGEWVLATCKTYLLLIPTKLPNSSSGELGFEKQMGKTKPIPRRLHLKQEDLRLVGGKVSFTPAHFNMGRGEETSIITSTGGFIITWDFKKAKEDKDVYSIKKYDSPIVANQFKFGEDKAMVVAMPEEVHLAKRLQRRKGNKP